MIDSYYDINKNLEEDLIMLIESSSGDYLDVYSKIVCYYTKYMQNTKQTCHILVNNTN